MLPQEVFGNEEARVVVKIKRPCKLVFQVGLDDLNPMRRRYYRDKPEVCIGALSVIFATNLGMLYMADTVSDPVFAPPVLRM